MNNLEERIEKIIITEEEIEQGIAKAADWINNEYKDKKPIILGILKGCIPFFGKILPKLKIECSTEFMAVCSFKGGTQACIEPTITLDINVDVKDQDILILEDIIDTARTLYKIVNLLKERGAKSVRIVTLLDKKQKRTVNLNADYSCFEIPDIFIIGFGLDYKEIYRNLPYICTLKKEYIDKK